MENTQKEKLIGLVKEVRYSPFPGGALDVSVANQLPEHAFEAIAEHLIANGVVVREKGRWIAVNECCNHAKEFRCSACGETVDYGNYTRNCDYDSCPNCCADMR